MYNLTQEQLGSLTPAQKGDLAKTGLCDRPEMIRRLLKERGLTPAAFARKHGFAGSSVYACMDVKRPLPEIREKLAHELGLPEWVLFGVEDSETVARAS